MKTWFKVGITTLYIPLILLFQGWVLLNLWEWFITPWMPSLTLYRAMGLVVLAHFLTYQRGADKNEERIHYTVVISTVFIALSLVLGYVIHLLEGA